MGCHSSIKPCSVWKLCCVADITDQYIGVHTFYVFTGLVTEYLAPYGTETTSSAYRSRSRNLSGPKDAADTLMNSAL